MKNISEKSFYIFLVLLFMWTATVGAQTKITRNGDFLKQLISGNDSTQSLILQELIADKDPSTFPLLNAINDKKFYLYENIPVTTGEKTIGENETELYTVYRLY